jgi:hypothetical protein
MSDNIKIDLREVDLDGRKWMELAHDPTQMRALIL